MTGIPATGSEPSSGEAGRLVLVATPIGNLGDLVAARGRGVALRRRHRGRGHPAHPRAAHPRRDPGRGVGCARCTRTTSARRATWVVDAIRGGRRVAYVTDAGMPGISDPGERLVRGVPRRRPRGRDRAGAERGARPRWCCRGFPTDRFVFEGFLPRRGASAASASPRSRARRAPSCCSSRPNRVAATLADLLAACGPLRRGRRRPRAHEAARGGVAGHARRGRRPRASSPSHAASTCSCSRRRPPPPEASDDEIDAHVSRRARRGSVDPRRRRPRRPRPRRARAGAPTTSPCASAAAALTPTRGCVTRPRMTRLSDATWE